MRYSKDTRRLHKERIRQLIVSDANLGPIKAKEILAGDKANPLVLDRIYIGSIMREVRDEIALKIRTHTVEKILVEQELQYQEARKKLWDIIHGPPVKYFHSIVPDPNDSTKTIKKVDSVRISNRDINEAIRTLDIITRNYENKMLVAGQPAGIERVDLNHLGDSTNLTVNINNGSEEELKKRNKELDAEFEALEREFRRYSANSEGDAGTEKHNPEKGTPIEKAEADDGSEIPPAKPAVSGDASNDDGVHRVARVSGNEGGHVSDTEESSK